jgi:hypothetical protein
MKRGGTWYAKRRKQREMRRAALATLTLYTCAMGIISIVAYQELFKAKPVEAQNSEIYTVEKPVVPPLVEVVQETVEQIIERKAAEYGVDAEYAKKISFCESSNDPSAVNWQGSSASGLFMFTRDTFLDGIRWRGLDWTLNDRFDAEKSTDMAMWFVKKEGWKRWACEKIVE